MNKDMDEDQDLDTEEATMNEEFIQEAEVVMEQQTLEQKLLTAWVASNYSGTTTQYYRIFAVKCKVGPFPFITKS